MSENELNGGCLCGDVRYRIDGEPIRVGVCHCETCRRTSGAAFLFYAIYPREQVAFLSGETKHFQAPSILRHFCPECGAGVFLEKEVGAPAIVIYAGSLDDPGGLAPEYELWTDRRAPWLPEFPDTVCYARNYGEGAGDRPGR